MILFNETMNKNNAYTINDITNESADIVYEFSNEINNNLSALYVSDIVLETYVDEGREVSSLIEGTVKDAIGNAVNAISTFMKRIIEWFKKVYLMMTDKTKKISEYIKNNDNYSKLKNKIQIKGTVNISDEITVYKDFQYSSIVDYMDNLTDIFSDIQDDADIDIEKFTNKDKLKEIDDIFFDKDSQPKVINKDKLIEYLNFCRDSRSLLNDIRDMEKTNVNLCKDIISYLKKLENKPDNYMEKIKYCRQLLVYMQSATNRIVSNIQSMTLGKFKVIKNIKIDDNDKVKYNNRDIVTYEKDENDNEFWYDDDGNKTHVKGADGTEIQYDPKTGKKTYHKEPDGTEYWIKYNTRGEKIYVRDSNGYEYWYDPKTGKTIHGKDTKGIEYWYDPKTGKATRIKHPDGYEELYDPKTGKETHEKDSDGYEIWYDPKTGNKTHEKDSNGKETWYNKDGKVIKEK